MKILEPSSLNVGVRLVATGSATGARVVDNAALHAMGYPEPPERIERLTGIVQRHHLGADEDLTTLAWRASQRALEAAALAPERVDQLIVSSSAPEALLPSLGARVHGMLGLRGAPAHTINAACAGFVFGVDLAVRAICTGAERVVVCAAEARAQQVDVEDRAAGALFGDGAGAFVLERCRPGQGFLSIGITTQPDDLDAITLPRGGTLRMQDGPRVYFEAVEGLARVGEALLAHHGLSWGDVARVIPHQANGRIVQRLCWLAGLDDSRVITNLSRRGNTSSASIPLAFDEALRAGELEAGALVLLLTVGAGGAAGGALLRVDEALITALTRPSDA